MTEEQKAAAKAAKAALTPEQKAAAKAAKPAKTPEQKAKAKTPGAPKKVAWAEGGGAASAVSVVRNIEAEMDALIATM